MTDPENPPPKAAAPPPIDAYPRRAVDVLRFSDTDAVGHVNNAVFATFFETGRVSFLYAPPKPLAPEGTAFVLARLVIDFRAEVTWPGEVEIGTRVATVGRSSFTMHQGLFQHGRCVATAESVCVLIAGQTRKPTALPAEVLEALRG